MNFQSPFYHIFRIRIFRLMIQLRSLHFFPNISPYSLLKVCITNREQIARNFSVPNKNKAAVLSRIGLKHNMKYYLCMSLLIWLKNAKNG